MESNKIINEQIFEIINNQIRANNPPETNLTLKRLIGLGYNDNDARMLIGQCVAVETYNVMKRGEPFNETRYTSNLKKLPEEPSGDKFRSMDKD